MSRLTVWDAASKAELLRTENPRRSPRPEIRRRAVRALAGRAAAGTPEEVLAAYKPRLDAFLAETAAGTADVIQLTPDHPMKAALRNKFLKEHTHTEDEVRFFHEGAGNFVLHLNGRVYDAHCTQGDLISVPANAQHWFDNGDARRTSRCRCASSPTPAAGRRTTPAPTWRRKFPVVVG